MWYIPIEVFGLMKKNALLSIIVAGVVIIAAAFLAVQYLPDSDVDQEEIDDTDTTPNVVGNLTFRDAVNAFAFDMFREIYNSSEDNSFISPYSIFTALAMTYEGAKGTTAEEMKNTLSVEQDNASFHEYMQTLYELLNVRGEEYNLSTANALWVKETLPLLDEYLSVIRTFYGGEATEVDFSNPEQAAEIINQWVENQTNGLIEDLVPADVIDPFLTALILTNAIYFKGIWKVQFDPANTTDREFQTIEGSLVEVPTMALVNTEDTFSYVETEELQILELPYTGDDLSMVILLPKDDATTLPALINSIDDQSLLTWSQSMYETPVDIYLPKFTVETSASLKHHLIRMGMNVPFTSTADFSGITGYKDLFISEVLHKAFIDVNEEGTEAAAATAVVMTLTGTDNGAPSRIVFDCDHPFMYLIQHKQTGTILFMGTVLDPSS